MCARLNKIVLSNVQLLWLRVGFPTTLTITVSQATAASSSCLSETTDEVRIEVRPLLSFVNFFLYTSDFMALENPKLKKSNK